MLLASLSGSRSIRAGRQVKAWGGILLETELGWPGEGANGPGQAEAFGLLAKATLRSDRGLAVVG